MKIYSFFPIQYAGPVLTRPEAFAHSAFIRQHQLPRSTTEMIGAMEKNIFGWVKHLSAAQTKINSRGNMKRFPVLAFTVPNYIVASLVLFCVLAFTGCSATRAVGESASTASTPTVVPAKLPAVYKCEVERIGGYERGSYHIVSVKCKGDDVIRSYYTDSMWILVKPGDVVVMTPSHYYQQVIWSMSVYFAEFPKTRVTTER